MGDMSLYYQDDHVTLYHGDSLEILPTLDIKADVLLTDPPYFKVKQDAWDNQWGGASEFLSWMGEWLDLTKPLLTTNASAWVFASPAMTTAVERVIGERFRVLNSIRWVKEAGWHQKSELATLRSFLSPWEGIVFAGQFHDEYGALDYAGRKQAYGKAGMKLSEARSLAGMTRAEVAPLLLHIYRNIGTAKAMISDWEIGKKFISKEAHAALGEVYGAHLPGHDWFVSRYAELKLEHESARREYEGIRRTFTIADRALSADIWHFPTVKPYKGKHPCEKPVQMLRHMIEASSKPGGLILDPFAGSGATLETARNAGRRALGIEQDEQWCEQIARRLSADTLDLEEVA